MRTHATAHVRRYYEMMQVRELVGELGIEPLMAQATTAFFERSIGLALSKAFPRDPLNHDEVLKAWTIRVNARAKGEGKSTCGLTQ